MFRRCWGRSWTSSGHLRYSRPIFNQNGAFFNEFLELGEPLMVVQTSGLRDDDDGPFKSLQKSNQDRLLINVGRWQAARI